MTTRIVWFRRDLRLADNAALNSALASEGTVVPVALAVDAAQGGETSRSWRGLSLAALDESLRARGNALTLLDGSPAPALCALALECDALAVYCSRDWTPQGVAEEAAVRDALSGIGIALHVSEGQLLSTPTEISSGAGTPYRVFTPYFRAWRPMARPAEPLPAPDKIAAPAGRRQPGPLPKPDPNALEVSKWWTPGEVAAAERLAEFAAEAVLAYDVDRDVPSVRGTSELSPRLAFGELSPAQVLHALRNYDDAMVEPFIRQLAWREFAYHVLHHNPHTATMPLRQEFADFPWNDDPRTFEAWKSGVTGYPFVDAGMRQLAATGWMHNRVRLVCASFLTKDLLVPWQSGEAFFRERLVDYDPALNTFNWQWVAGSGADAAPYFRIFNPTTQQKRFDAEGAYVRTWVQDAGPDYPAPIVDHAEARQRALAAYAAIRGAAPRA